MITTVRAHLRKGRFIRKHDRNYSSSWKKDPYDKTIKTKLKLIDPLDIEPIEPDSALDRLRVEEIKESGDIIRPVMVHGKFDPTQKYQSFEGHHRIKAAKERGDELIPAYVVDNISARQGWRKRKGLI